MADLRGVTGKPAVPGLLMPGNIDIMHRPTVRNRNGSVSTVLSTSFGIPSGEVLVPQVVGGRVVSPIQAWKNYQRTGQHLGIFANPKAANAYAEWLHRQQAGLVAAALAKVNANG